VLSCGALPLQAPVPTTDKELSRYRQRLIQQTGLTFPRFAPNATHLAPILSVLENPSLSSRVSGCCSLNNKDDVCARLRATLRNIGVRADQVVFWNFYAAYEGRYDSKVMSADWAAHLKELIDIMPNLRVMITFGNVVWEHVRDLELPSQIVLIGAPHPSNRGLAGDRESGERRIVRAWQRAKEIVMKNEHG
jgi:hypothetical protein